MKQKLQKTGIWTMPKATPYFYTTFSTPLGDMIAVADTQHIHLLQFADAPHTDTILAMFALSGSGLVKKKSAPLQQLEKELSAYFAGTLTQFTTPLYFVGTPFYQAVWKALLAVSYGTTQSYKDIAHAIKKPTSFRAVGQANGKNRIAIIVPCHRIITNTGTLGGYSSGLERKQWLLAHEKNRLSLY
jgi:AraC family transcriptional regulator of adaptative response/methylated-DNA-[protein]-cysteine methyltransferase